MFASASSRFLSSSIIIFILSVSASMIAFCPKFCAFIASACASISAGSGFCSSGCCGGIGGISVLINVFASLNPAISIILVKVLAYCCKSTKGFCGPRVCIICSCFCASEVRTWNFSSSDDLDIATLTTISLSESQYLGSTGINSLFNRITSWPSWCLITKEFTSLNKSFIPSAKCLQISSILPCAPDIVADTAEAVELCRASAFNPALAFDTPVRFSLDSSK